ncbi:hypothetical protein CORMATOL_02067 [Corynebacterium matruchotii ATCC 33806]|uniref:Uncharacterized protein n=1 Tax=Corynebacterium matruchotii ATCC 33806 TaxID=566549 RepID=C0E4Z2_9CORY|nr:hypothetical protein CORMATOL_02067 [Corynebacterium matruchotii ATCC 33806]
MLMDAHGCGCGACGPCCSESFQLWGCCRAASLVGWGLFLPPVVGGTVADKS